MSSALWSLPGEGGNSRRCRLRRTRAAGPAVGDAEILRSRGQDHSASCAPHPGSPLASNTGCLLGPWETKPRLGFHPRGTEGYLPPHWPQGLTLPDSLPGLPALSLLWGSQGCPVCAAWWESGQAPALSKGSRDPSVLGDPILGSLWFLLFPGAPRPPRDCISRLQ